MLSGCCDGGRHPSAQLGPREYERRGTSFGPAHSVLDCDPTADVGPGEFERPGGPFIPARLASDGDPTARFGLGWFGRGDAPFHLDAASIDGVRHRLRPCLKEIARKARNRRWRVCISAPFTDPRLRVCVSVRSFKNRWCHPPLLADLCRSAPCHPPCSAERQT